VRRVRVLVVHPQALARKRASLALAGDDQFEVVGTAPNGRIAAAKVLHVQPDALVVDPDLDAESNAALQELRRTHRALLFFAFPSVAEPSVGSEAGEVLVQSRMRDDLLPKIVAAIPWAKEGPQLRTRSVGTPRVDVVAIGVSTGGPNALAAIVPRFPADLPVPIVVVQHMPPLFTRLLAERLTNLGPVPFVEATAGLKLEAGKGYIAPGDWHMTLQREGDAVQIALNQEPPENSCRPAVDVLYRSVADTYGPHTLAVVLTGMGSDGQRGAETIRTHGGRVLAQDEATSVVWGMPGAVVKAGLADGVLPLDDIALGIVRSVREGRSWNPAGLAGLLVESEERRSAEARSSVRAPVVASPVATPRPAAPAFVAPAPRPAAPFPAPRPATAPPPPPRPAVAPATAPRPSTAPAMASTATHISPEDFAFISRFIYDESAIVLEVGKEYLVESRLLTTARKRGLKDIHELVDQLRRAPTAELQRMVVEAMTTNETSFFRDVDPFEALRKAVLPELLKARAADRRLRIWCGAASSGQEPYSIAMLLREHFPQLAGWKVDLVSSDISIEMLERCRGARYSQLEVGRGLPAPLLVKYFERDGALWRLRPEIRDMVGFFELNLAGPWPSMEPFDVVFMRNVLIYFDTDTKRQILGKIKRLLRPDGYLFLGGAETTFNIDDGFVRETSDRVSFYRLGR
jgi:chemotaxis protein methyltransferase CheR